MIKVKDGYAKLIGTTYLGSSNHLLLSNGGAWEVHTGRNNEVNKIVRTDSNGFLLTGWINTTSGDTGTNTINKIYCSNDGYIRYKTPANFFSTLTNSGDNISITVASLNRTLTVLYANIAGLLRSKGTIAPLTGRTLSLGDVYSYHLNSSVSGGPTTNAAVIGFGKGTSGTVEIAGEWTNGRGLWVRALRDVTDNWYSWDKVLTLATYTGITDSRYYTKTLSDDRFVNITGDTMTGTLTLANSSVNTGTDTTELFRVYSSTGYKNGLSIFSIDNKTYINAKPYGTGTANALYLRTYNSGAIDALILAANGNATFVGSVTAPSFVGNASSATKLTSSAGSPTLPIYFLDGKPTACTASYLFSDLSNSGNNISITIAGQNRTLTVAYASNADTLDSLHANSFVRSYNSLEISGDLKGNYMGMSTSSGINSNWWHILCGAWNGEFRWNSLLALPTLNRNGVYYRSGLDDNTAWGAWVKLLDVNNYSSVLDTRYITDITTSTNKLTFTKNGSNINKDITVNVVYSLGNLTNISNKDSTTKASSGLFIYNSYSLTIGTNSYSSVLSINTGGTIQIAGNWGDDLTRNLYWRSLSDRAVASYPWKSWRTILDNENYSSILDSRYYTESEVNDLLNAKLNRQNLSYGNWNPRGYNLAADYFYNGGDLSISESGGLIHVSIDGYFWLNEGQYRVLDTSDVAGLKNDLTVHLYLSNTDTTWWPLIWGGNSHNNSSDSTGAVYKSHDVLSWLTSSLTLYATHLRTIYIDLQNNRGISLVTSGGTSPYKGIILPNLQSNGIGMFSRVGNGADEGGIIISEDTCVIYNSFDAGWGLSVRNKDLNQTDISSDDTVAFGIRENTYKLYSRGGFEKKDSSNDYVLLGGGGHKLISDFATAGLYVKYGKVAKSTTDNANATPYLYNVENEEVISGYYNHWYIFNMGQYSGGNYGTLLAMPYQNTLTDSELFIRSAKSGTWRDWRRILHSNNYTAYTVKKDGTGASGTWRISITGNADTVDGYHETAFPRLVGIKGNTWNWNDVIRAGYYKIQSGTITNHPSGIYPFGMAEVITTENHNDGENRELQIYYPHSQTNNIAIWLRMHNGPTQGNGWGGWVGVPNTNGNIASATKLQTPRTIWGLTFDGTANVSGNMSGVGLITFSDLTGTNGRSLLYLKMADNDYFRIYVGGTASNSGYAEIATADDGNEPIYVRQYTGVFSTIKRTLTLLDGSGNTSFPGNITTTGLIYAAHFYENSDVRLKHNIELIHDSNNIPEIKLFDWKESGKHSYGLIALELEENGYSELVETKEDGYKSVNYSAALSLIIGKLQVKIRELEKEIENLKIKS